MNLYRVQVETEIMVMANDKKQAVEIAKKGAAKEIAEFGRGSAFQVNNLAEIPKEWMALIPYAPDGYSEARRCIEIVAANKGDKKQLPEEDIEAIISVKEKSEGKSMAEQVEQLKPETRPDPKPKELNWHETQSGRPILRFIK